MSQQSDRTDKEYVISAILSARSSPQELLCLDEASAKKVRFAIYGLRYSLAALHPEVMSITVKVRGSTVFLEPKEQKIIGLQPVDRTIP